MIFQPWQNTFSILDQFVPFLVLTVASWPAYRLLRRQVRWSGISHLLKNFPQFAVIHIVKGLGIVNKEQLDVFLELSCFFNDPTDAGNLISGSSAFSKSSLNIWRFTVHVLLKTGLKDFEHYFASVWEEYTCAAVWTFFWHCLSLGLEWKLTFSSPVATAEFSKFAGIFSGALSQHHLLDLK